LKLLISNIIAFATLTITLLVASAPLSAQETRTLSGTIKLDAPRLDRDLVLEISVNNHSFVFAPIIGIIRPIQSMVTETVIIPLGENEANYSLQGIVENPVDYSIRISCIECGQIVPNQFYTEGGNKFGLVNSAFIDPNDLPSELPIDVISRASISGSVNLQTPSDKDLRFTLMVADSNTEAILASNDQLTIRATDNSANFSIDGISRSSLGYTVSIRCTNCFGRARKPITFDQQLNPLLNHSNIDFILEDQGKFSLSSILELLSEK